MVYQFTVLIVIPAPTFIAFRDGDGDGIGSIVAMSGTMDPTVHLQVFTKHMQILTEL